MSKLSEILEKIEQGNNCKYWHDRYDKVATMLHRVIYEVDDYCKDWRLIQQAKDLLKD